MEPKDFYFELCKQVSGHFFLITPKRYYDLEGCLSDESGVADAVLPIGFYELTESTYEYDGNSEMGRQILINLGMTEISFGLQPGEPVQPGGDDEEYDEGHYREEDDENDLDNLLNNGHNSNSSFDYENLSTDKLLRHLKIMVTNEDFLEAAKIKKELDSRNVQINF